MNRKAAMSAIPEIPAELKRAIDISLGQVWTVASQLAAATTETIRQEADTALSAATNERDEALSEIDRLETVISSLQQQVTTLEQARHLAHNVLEQHNQQIVQLTGENASLSTRLGHRDEQVQSLKNELKASRQDNQKLQAQLLDIVRQVSP